MTIWWQGTQLLLLLLLLRLLLFWPWLGDGLTSRR